MSNLSPAPGTPQTPTKAFVSGALTFAAAFVSYWIADKDPFTAKEIGEAVLISAVASGVIGGGTFAVKNRPTR